MEIENKRKLLVAKSNASSSGNLKLFATVCNKLARYYFEEDNFDSALSEYLDELEANKKLNDRLKTALCHRMISEIHLIFCDFKKAADHAKHFYLLAKEEENVVEQQRAVLTLGRIFFTHASTLLANDSDSIEGHALAKQSEEMLNKSLRLITKIKNASKKEIQEMIAVALLNIGLNYELQRRNDEALKKFDSATSVCVKYDIHDTLYNCYISLGAFHSNLHDYNKAINYLSLSISTAERLGDKEEKIANSRIDKAKIYFKMGEHLQAQNELTRANKLRINSLSLKNEIKLNLKRANTLCRLQRELQRTPLHDHLLRKALFEHVGDVLSSMQLFALAVAAYENMLANAEAAGETGKQLLPAIVSLAATLLDDGQFARAADFYQRELEVMGDDPEEASRTTLNLGAALEKSGAPYHEAEAQYAAAKALARRAGNRRLIGNALQHLIDLQEAAQLDGLAAESRHELSQLSEPSDSEGSESESQERDTQDVALDSSTDESDGSAAAAAATERPRGRTLKVTRNEKGETPLHRACIDGNLARVRSLLDQGHPVNVRDNAGWLPLHEACSYDRTEIAGLLLDRGAWLDDPGDAHCEGVTPLIDACCNGHLDTVRLLIDRGVNLLTKNTNGETALDNLLSWYRRAKKTVLSQEFINNFQQIEDILRKAQIKAGVPYEDLPPKSIDTNSGKKRSASTHEQSRRTETSTQPTKRPCIESADSNEPRRKHRHVGTLRNRVDSSDSDTGDRRYRPISPHRANPPRQRNDAVTCLDFDDDADEDVLAPPGMSAGERAAPSADDYVSAMEGVRRRVQEATHARVFVEDRPALLAEGEVGDDWLVDDMLGNNSKRRKYDGRTGKEFLGQPLKAAAAAHPRLSLGPSSRSHQPKTAAATRSRLESTSSSSEDDPVPPAAPSPPSSPLPVAEPTPSKILDLDDFYDDVIVDASPLKSQRSRLQQPSLLTSSFGFSRRLTDRPRGRYDPLRLVPEAAAAAAAAAAGLPIAVAVSAAAIPAVNLSVKIRIEGTLFLLPVVAEQTIGELADEAAKRYFNIHGVKPSLSLVTSDGALLASGDPVSLIAGADEVGSTVESWNVPSLAERYREACRLARSEPDADVEARMAAGGGSGGKALALDDLALPTAGFVAVWRAVHRQDWIARLDLTGNVMHDAGMKLLADALPKLELLEDLLLGSNFITDVGLSHLSNVLMESTNLLQKLKLLDLSHNFLDGGQTLTSLAEILDRVAVKSLSLRSCKLNADMFHFAGSAMPRLLNLDAVESLDLGYNSLGREGVAFFVGRLNVDHLANLNLAATGRTDSHSSEIAKELVLFFEREAPINLKTLDLSRDRVGDDDVTDLMRVLATSLESLDVSGNELGPGSMRVLLGRGSSIACLNATGCPDVCGGDSCDGWLAEGNVGRLRTLTVSADDEVASRGLERTWRNVWGGKAVCRRGPFGFVCLSVKH